MRDIQMVLERYGAWAAGCGNEGYYAPIAAGFKGLLPASRKSRSSCSDNDGLIINGAMARLKKHDPLLCIMLEWYYILCIPVRTMGVKLGVSHTQILKRLQAGEGFIEGVLAMLDVTLEIDRECQKQNFYSTKVKKVVEFQKAI
ncbi:antitermination protein [Superficieibacter electus]|uniref:Antitermination protein n=1 Tax=Superficieibacter electus TaxID=2022662 RepID=A0A2P5GP32_9ENTR|nr:antiterminator Q family protein [Superficieibacter electus]POP44946.1 antitermination protein [Superficieibacter electus]POP48333.1 antitermination protein [Superficieibacter electus]